jgi:uncharacterized protein YyaL (SSP411 family)
MFRGGLLLHTYKDGQAKLLGYLDDYAFLAVGLLDLYETFFEPTYLERAVQLADIMIQEFSDEHDGAFFFTGKSHERLITRTKPVFDASIPSGNAMAAHLLLRLYHFTGKNEHRERAEKILRSHYDAMETQPFGFAHMLCAMDLYQRGAREIVIVGYPSEPALQELLAEVHSVYLPNKILQIAAPDKALADLSPLLAGKKQMDAKPTVYVCENFTCSAPVTSPADLKRLLETAAADAPEKQSG